MDYFIGFLLGNLTWLLLMKYAWPLIDHLLDDQSLIEQQRRREREARLNQD